MLIPGLIASLLLLFTVLICHHAIVGASTEKIFNSSDKIPNRQAAVVMGCSRILSNGRPNLFFILRINAAVELFQAGKCEYLIVSGDNGNEDYDEPSDMRDALIARGIPENQIYRDYAGFRTLDSVVRAKEIFGQDDFIVVSQKFHNERAIYIAQKHGCKSVIAYNAGRVGTFGGVRTRLREYLARVKTVLDVSILKTKPRFLGPSVALGGPVT